MLSATEGNGRYDTFILEIILVLVACFSAWKMVSFCNPEGGGRSITSFYALIAITAIVRLGCILFESYLLQEPLDVMAFSTAYWWDITIAEASQILGTIMIYSVFILLVCFWSHMSTKVQEREMAESRPLVGRQSALPRRGPVEKFSLIMIMFFVVEISNYVLFMMGFYDSVALIAYDSIVIGSMSAILLVEMSFFSTRIQSILKTIAAINSDSSPYQIKRIRAITIVNVCYLLVRLIVESVSLYTLYHNWRGE